MKIEMLSSETQAGLRLWANDALGDELVFDGNASAPEFWAWICFLLWSTDDKPEWFPKGKSATIQVIEMRLLREALAVLPAEVRERTQHAGERIY